MSPVQARFEEQEGCERREKTTEHDQEHGSHSGRRKRYIPLTAVTRKPAIDQQPMIHDPGSGGGCKSLALDDLSRKAHEIPVWVFLGYDRGRGRRTARRRDQVKAANTGDA